jgi:putative ABC transport system permease protein
MNLVKLSASYLRARALNTALQVVLFALGIGTITLLLLATTQLDQRMRRDAEGIDLVIGAKGSPLQIILSAIYHLDVPTGNIAYMQAKEIAAHRAVKKTIPLALGDSYRGFRIAGTTHDYVAHYGATLASGKLWQQPLDAVIGAEVAARTGHGVGAKFAGAHGMGEGGDAHEGADYTVVGVLAPSGTVLDRLVLTSVESVWAVHAQHQGVHDIANAAAQMKDEEKEYTALLVQYASPLAAAILPRYVNNNSDMQAASPAFETARLFSIIGVGTDVLRGFALVLVFSAALSVFIALYNALEERRYDLAIMRTLGASPFRLMTLLLGEGMLLAGIGGLCGIALGHVFAELTGMAMRAAQQGSMTGWIWLPEEFIVLALAILVGALAAVIPAWRAYRTDIAGTLSRA